MIKKKADYPIARNHNFKFGIPKIRADKENSRNLKILGIDQYNDNIDEKRLKNKFSEFSLKNHPDKGGDKDFFDSVNSTREKLKEGIRDFRSDGERGVDFVENEDRRGREISDAESRGIRSIGAFLGTNLLGHATRKSWKNKEKVLRQHGYDDIADEYRSLRRKNLIGNIGGGALGFLSGKSYESKRPANRKWSYEDEINHKKLSDSFGADKENKMPKEYDNYNDAYKFRAPIQGASIGSALGMIVAGGASRKNIKRIGDLEKHHGIHWKQASDSNVQLDTPIHTPGERKKFLVHTKDESGKIKKVRFGDPNMTIKNHIPARQKSFWARHNCDNPGPKTKPRYWSCHQWKEASQIKDKEEAKHHKQHAILLDETMPNVFNKKFRRMPEKRRIEKLRKNFDVLDKIEEVK